MLTFNIKEIVQYTLYSLTVNQNAVADFNQDSLVGCSPLELSFENNKASKNLINFLMIYINFRKK